MMKFTDFSFSPNILEGIKEIGYVDCTAVQEETFKITEDGRDIIAQSQTGTGKTAAFLLASYYLKERDDFFKERPVVILVPTRELCDQIAIEAEQLGTKMNYKVATIYGGMPYEPQKKKIQEGIDYLVGTPGRILDFIEQGVLDLGQTGILILDEADRMIDMGFLPDIREIISKMPPPQERKTYLYSATLNSRVGNFAWEFMNDPAEILINPEEMTVTKVEQELYHIESSAKFSYLLGLLGQQNPERTIIFLNTKRAGFILYEKLERHGYPAEYLNSDQPQHKRLQIVNAFKSGKIPILVATDVAARGLHVEDISLVLNYDVPNNAENYVHRIGRTARAGKSGKTITFACENFVYHLPEIERLIGMKIPSFPIDETLLLPEKRREREFDSRGERDPGPRRSREGGSPRRERDPGPRRDREGRSSRSRSGGKPQSSEHRFKEKARNTQSQINDLISSSEGSGFDSGNSRRGGSEGEREVPFSPRKPRSKEDRFERKKSLTPESSEQERLDYYSKKYDENFNEILAFKSSLSSST